MIEPNKKSLTPSGKVVFANDDPEKREVRNEKPMARVTEFARSKPTRPGL